MLPGLTPLSPSDIECVTRRQLLLPPGSAWELEQGSLKAGHRCRHGWPQVLVMDPLRASARIGDMMRLTCPLLVAAIDDYELTAIQRYNARLKCDEKWQSQMLATNEAHKSLRKAFLRKRSEEMAEARRVMGNQTVEVIMSSGISNMRFCTNSSDVKCLHAQVADELSRGNNAIGRQVLIDLTDNGLEVDGTSHCCDFCNISQPLNGSRWTFGHAKNNLRTRVRWHNR